MQPPPAPTPRSSTPADSSSSANKPVLYLATHIHPESRVVADQLFDVIDDQDERFATWTEYADAAVLRIGKITPEEAHRAKKLRIIARNGVGYESVPLEACKELGIAATYQPGSNSKAVAEIALSLAIAVARRTAELDRRMRRGEVMPNITVLAETVEGKTVGLVGMGDIAYETAKKFYGAFDTPILVYSPTSSPLKWTEQDPDGKKPIPHTRVSSLDELLERADIVSLHCPQTPQTTNMISDAQLAKMKSTGILVNTARGGLIDEPALLRALQSKQIYGAGLDVLVHEPGTLENYGELYKQDNVVVLPHAGGGTHQVQITSCTRAVMTCWHYLRGEGVAESVRLV
ncbi:hypothetical protein JCM8097_007749 [Rhodosporidiobolus ruineniae]